MPKIINKSLKTKSKVLSPTNHRYRFDSGCKMETVLFTFVLTIWNMIVGKDIPPSLIFRLKFRSSKNNPLKCLKFEIFRPYSECIAQKLRIHIEHAFYNLKRMFKLQRCITKDEKFSLHFPQFKHKTYFTKKETHVLENDEAEVLDRLQQCT